MLQPVQTVTLEEAQARLPELLEALSGKSELVITRDGKNIARLSPLPEATAETGRPPCSMLDWPPCDLGQSLRPYPGPDDDILGEMIDSKFGH